MTITDAMIEAASEAILFEMGDRRFLDDVDEDLHEEIGKALAKAALEAAEHAAWRPIEEAPKDGSAILGWNSEYGARETRSETYRPGSPGYAQGLTDRWWTWDEPVSNWARRWKPTHFRPLPTPGEQG